MWSFLFALILGTYWIIKLVVEKGEVEASRNHYDRMDYERRMFDLQYSVNLMELRNFRDGLKYRLDARSDLKRQLEEITGIDPTPTMIEWAYFAKKGVVPEWTTYRSNGKDNVFSIGHDVQWLKSPRYHGKYDIRAMQEGRLKFIKWFDEELRSHGMEHKVMFVHNSTGETDGHGNLVYYYGDRKPVSECTFAFNTVFFWEPMRLVVDHLYDK